MNRTYSVEMATLPHTYAEWRCWHGRDELPDGARRLRGTGVFVASGGSLAVAHLAARLHQERYGTVCSVMTPLAYATSAVTADTVMVISDSMSHPDALLAVESVRRRRVAAPVLLTNRPARDLRPMVGDLPIVECPRPGNDGWIATNSILSLSLGVLTLYAEPAEPPAMDEWWRRWLEPDGTLLASWDGLRERVLCLFAPDLQNVAVDLETRIMEAGLGSVCATDLRNLGHGRHVGLYRNAADLSVLILSTPAWNRLARATAGTLPDGVHHQIWRASRAGPWAAVELLLPSAGLLATRAVRHGTDPGNPAVWHGGEALFRMGLHELVPSLAGNPG